MKTKTIILTLSLGVLTLMTSRSFAQENTETNPASTEIQKSDSIEARELQVEKDQARMTDVKRERKQSKAKAKEAQRVGREANDAARESNSAFKAEKKAQKMRKQADKQAQKAAKSRDKSDKN